MIFNIKLCKCFVLFLSKDLDFMIDICIINWFLIGEMNNCVIYILYEVKDKC